MSIHGRFLPRIACGPASHHQTRAQQNPVCAFVPRAHRPLHGRHGPSDRAAVRPTYPLVRQAWNAHSVDATRISVFDVVKLCSSPRRPPSLLQPLALARTSLALSNAWEPCCGGPTFRRWLASCLQHQLSSLPSPHQFEHGALHDIVVALAIGQLSTALPVPDALTGT